MVSYFYYGCVCLNVLYFNIKSYDLFGVEEKKIAKIWLFGIYVIGIN